MNILITGGYGFLATRLAKTLLQHDKFSVSGQAPQTIHQIILTDLVSPGVNLQSDHRIQFIGGNLRKFLAEGELFTKEIDLVFHLAAAVSAECEADFDLGMPSNINTTLELLQACCRSDRVTVGEMAQNPQRLGGAEAFHRLDWVIDSAIARVVKSWPGQNACSRAARLGPVPDMSFDAVVQQYIDGNCSAIQAR
ncbi:MAG: NAD-dependent epimerase/dehydratase family protein [Betaproteobacteria bacterium]